ncbi:hypothetical protein NUW54_g4573 [Trametes sanguinea]|uniref:Uncharacterized protein n=1 Tax=Trametes sanguinea TaxID=158606 RepID=A0ACC1PXJ0_9APHY|nr:hypothetical protein NUW54_g4573 [Trametes sanguinea]
MRVCLECDDACGSTPRHFSQTSTIVSIAVTPLPWNCDYTPVAGCLDYHCQQEIVHVGCSHASGSVSCYHSQLRLLECFLPHNLIDINMTRESHTHYRFNGSSVDPNEAMVASQQQHIAELVERKDSESEGQSDGDTAELGLVDEDAEGQWESDMEEWERASQAADDDWHFDVGLGGLVDDKLGDELADGEPQPDGYYDDDGVLADPYGMEGFAPLCLSCAAVLTRLSVVSYASVQGATEDLPDQVVSDEYP